MKYLCTNCSYIYDEALWDSQEDIKAWTLFDEMSEYFSCPVCGETSESFHEIKEEVLYADDMNHLSWLEAEHIPKVDIVDWKAIVNISHPMVESHYISSISLFDEYGDLVIEEFLDPNKEAKIEFDVSDLDEFEVRARCSDHGTWGSGMIENK